MTDQYPRDDTDWHVTDAIAMSEYDETRDNPDAAPNVDVINAFLGATKRTA